MAKGDATRNFYLTAIAQALTAQGEQVLDIASNAEKARKIERDRKAREVKTKAEQALKA